MSVWRFSLERGESGISLEAFCKRRTALCAEPIFAHTATSNIGFRKGAKCHGALNTKSEHMWGRGALEVRQRRFWKGFCERLASFDANGVDSDAGARVEGAIVQEK